MKKKALQPILLLFALVAIQPVFSQLNYLTFGTSNNAGTYTDLGANGTVITTTNFDDDNSAPQNIGFTFNYNGTAFTQFILNTNGFIKLGSTNPSVPNLFYTTSNGNAGGVFNSALPADSNILCVFNHDLQAGTGTPEYRVSTTGLPGSQVCTIQFKNVREKTTSPAIQYDNMQFQIKLYETTNTIEFIYGTWAPSANTSATKSAAVGLKGLNNTASQLLTVCKASAQTWDAVIFEAGNYIGAADFKFGNPSARPAPDAGRTLRFIQAKPKDAFVKLFTLGSIPTTYGASRIDSAIVRNIGMDTLKNSIVTLNITGANTFTDNKTILVLPPGASATVGFAPYSPLNFGTNSVSASISNDDNNTNNIDNYSQIVNATIFSYADAGKADGGISGQNNPGYLATKYTMTGTTSVIGANIYIAGDAASIGNKVYAILFDNLGNKLDSSASYTITALDTGKYHSFSLPLNAVISNSSFYIGLAQPTIGYNALGYQKETPARLGAYFIRGMNVPYFTDLDSGNSYNIYRLMIQAVISNTTGILQKANEYSVLAYPNPFNSEITFNIGNNNVNDVSFYLYDITGRIVKTLTQINTPEFKVGRENLQSGIYFYKLYEKEKIIDTGKLIIE